MEVKSRLIITHAELSRVSMAIGRVCVCDSVCFVRTIKTKTAETTITKRGTGIVHHDILPTN